MEVFVPGANALLIAQLDRQLPVTWSELLEKSSSLQDLALELVRFLDVNARWRHDGLHDVLRVIAGLKENTKEKTLNALDLRLRTETFLEKKLKGKERDSKEECTEDPRPAKEPAKKKSKKKRSAQVGSEPKRDKTPKASEGREDNEHKEARRKGCDNRTKVKRRRNETNGSKTRRHENRSTGDTIEVAQMNHKKENPERPTSSQGKLLEKLFDVADIDASFTTLRLAPAGKGAGHSGCRAGDAGDGARRVPAASPPVVAWDPRTEECFV